MSVILTERLSHLPENRRRELERIARILFGEFEDVQKSRLSDTEKGGRILKLLLFGPFARCDWVEDRENDGRSEYNLLVVVTTETFADPSFWYRGIDRFLRELTVTRHLATPVNFIVHSVTDLNKQLAYGWPFFVDIARDGILLYETPGLPRAKPKPQDPEVVEG
ncbi:hypothetical protein RsS62_04230 [Rhizobium dioscoreae]|uniref:hypothetical protein n=1 Tax=Rhizobium dioscoreae TaxID=2653122 RepID=UPI001260D1A8|nr:hypothetical protein [Rhizobium dioscoreae]GES41171.1 hypothetical protein RsS62_04230 [Rhizobium dioscoreae]